MPGHSVAIFEHDYQGQDYSLNAKATNPWPTDMSGIFVFSYLQSLTRNLALGGECLVTRSPMMPSGNATSLIGKWTSTDKSWIASASLMPDNTLNATYWHKLSEKVDVAAELMMSAGSVRREGLATLAAKYDLRMSTFRAQVDSAGKVGAVLEQRFTPVFAFTLNGEIDHFKVCILLSGLFYIHLTRETEHRKGRLWCADREFDVDGRGAASTNGRSPTWRACDMILFYEYLDTHIITVAYSISLTHGFPHLTRDLRNITTTQTDWWLF